MMLNSFILQAVVPSMTNTPLTGGQETLQGENNSFLDILQNIIPASGENNGQSLSNNLLKQDPNLTGDGLDNASLMQWIAQQNPLILQDLFNHLQGGLSEDIVSQISNPLDLKILGLLKEAFCSDNGLENELTETLGNRMEKLKLEDIISYDFKAYQNQAQDDLQIKDILNIEKLQESLMGILKEEGLVLDENKSVRIEELIKESLKDIQDIKLADLIEKGEAVKGTENKEMLSLKDLLIKIGALSSKEENPSYREFLGNKDLSSQEWNLAEGKTEFKAETNAPKPEAVMIKEEQSLTKEALNNLNKENINLDRNPEASKHAGQTPGPTEESLDIDHKAVSSIKEIVSERASKEFENGKMSKEMSLISEMEIKAEKIDSLDLGHKDTNQGMLNRESMLGLNAKESLGNETNHEIMHRATLEKLVVDQIIGKIGRQAFKNGKNEIKLSLKPEFLGELKMEISIEKNIFKADLIVENHFVKDLLDGNLDKLRQSLQTQGMEIQKFSVSVGQDPGRQAQNKNNFNRTVTADLGRDEIKLEENETVTKIFNETSRIDLLI